MLRDIFSFQKMDDASSIGREFNAVINYGNTTIQATGGRDNGPSLRILCSNSSFDFYVQKTYDAQQLWVVGQRMKTPLPTSSTIYFLKFVDGSTTHVQIGLGTDGTLKAYRNTVLLGSSTNAIVANTLYYIEVKVKIDDAVGTVDIRVTAPGGTPTSWLSLSSQDTRNGGNATANNIYWGHAGQYGSGSNFTNYCDGYVVDGQAGGATDFLGPVRADTRVFTADGTYTDWTPSTGTTRYEVVDDSAPNDDTDYATGATGNKMTLKTFSLGYTPASIYGVKLTGVMKKTASGTINVKRIARKSGTDYTSGNLTAPDTLYTHVSEVLEVDPATSAAFTKTDLEGVIEWGFEVV